MVQHVQGIRRQTRARDAARPARRAVVTRPAAFSRPNIPSHRPVPGAQSARFSNLIESGADFAISATSPGSSLHSQRTAGRSHRRLSSLAARSRRRRRTAPAAARPRLRGLRRHRARRKHLPNASRRWHAPNLSSASISRRSPWGLDASKRRWTISSALSRCASRRSSCCAACRGLNRSPSARDIKRCFARFGLLSNRSRVDGGAAQAGGSRRCARRGRSRPSRSGTVAVATSPTSEPLIPERGVGLAPDDLVARRAG
jgi:hypothetical protein